VNIESIETDTASAPWTGAPMFRMRAHVVVGQDLDVRFRPVFPVPERGLPQSDKP
jgi:hypothetical protein